MMNTANLLLDAVILGGCTPMGVQPMEAVESTDAGSPAFDGLVAKLLGRHCGETNVQGIKAGQQTRQYQDQPELLKKDEAQAAPDDIKWMLGSLGVVMEEPGEAVSDDASAPMSSFGSSEPKLVIPTELPEGIVIEHRSLVLGGSGKDNVPKADMPIQMDELEQQLVSTAQKLTEAADQDGSSDDVPTVQPRQLRPTAEGLTAQSLTSKSADQEVIQNDVRPPEPAARVDRPAPMGEREPGLPLIHEQTAPEARSELTAVQLIRSEKTGDVLNDPVVMDIPEEHTPTAASAVESLQSIEQTNVQKSVGHVPAVTANPQSRTEVNQAVNPGMGIDLELPAVQVTAPQPADRPNIRHESNSDGNDRTMDWLGSFDTRMPGFKAAEAVVNSQANLPPDPVLGAKMIDQIVKAAKVELTDGKADMILRLSPPHLGTVQMNVTVENGTVTAVLQTSTESARNILQADLGTLKQSLAEAGVHVDSINVTVGGSLDHGLQSHSGSHGWSTEHQANRGSWQMNGSFEPELNPELVGSTGSLSAGSFNYLA